MLKNKLTQKRSRGVSKALTNTKDYTKNAKFIYEVGSLRRIIRSHRQTLFVDDVSDTISTHSYRVTIIGWLLAKEENANPYKVVMMCLTHDLPEARSGDQNWVNKRYVKVFDDEIINDQIGSLPASKDLLEIIKEYEERKSLESILAKDADLIDQICLLREYEMNGSTEATVWLKGKSHYSMIKSKSGKKIADEIMKLKPTSWWHGTSTSKRR